MTIMDVMAKAVADDEQAGMTLLDHVAYAVMMEQAARNERLLNQTFDAQGTQAVRLAKAGLGRAYVAKAAEGEYPGEEMLTTASWLAGIENWLEVRKESVDWETWNTERGPQRRQVMRDMLGRFARIDAKPASVANRAPVEGKPLAPPVQRAVTPTKPEGAAPDAADVLKPNAGVRDQDVNQFQGRWEQAVGQAAQWKRQLGADSNKAAVELKLAGGGKAVVSLEEFAAGEGLEDVDVTSPIKGMKLVLASGQEGTLPAVNRMGFVTSLFSGNRQADFEQMMRPSSPDNDRLTLFLNRLGIAGKLLKEVDPTQKVAAMAELVGSFGPEAARIMGPHVQRAAYRYRGTERTPDERIAQYYEGDNDDALEYLADMLDDGAGPNEIKERIDAKGDDWSSPMLQSILLRAERANDEDDPLTGDTLRLRARSDVAALELLRTLPKNPKIAELSRESGHVLPSQGVLIDADGDLVSQSVGFAEDHYLPFDLANLNRLRGGQYVRTRQQGGLTGEDIYASVFHGARSATVASSSGVFRIEFAPDFRGARAMSDKAFSMYDRYLQILDKLQDSGMYTKDISAQEKAQIRVDVRRRLGAHADVKAVNEAVEAKITEARTRAQEITETDVKELADQAKKDVAARYEGSGKMPSGPALAAEVDERFAELKREKEESVVRELNLNDEGYYVALQTLAHQFPYFIRAVERESLVGSRDADAFEKNPVLSTGRWDMGFFAARGQHPARGPKPSRGPDANFVNNRLSTPEGRGVLTQRESITAQKLRTQRNEPVAPEGAPDAPGGPRPPATQVAGTGSRPGAPASTAAVDHESPAARQALSSGRLKVEQYDTLAAAFVNEMSQLLAPAKGYVLPGDALRADAKPALQELIAKPWEDLGTDKERLKWLLARETPKEMQDAIGAHLDEAIQLFAEIGTPKGLLDSAISEVMASDSSVREIVAENQPFGAKTVPEFYTAVRTQALGLANFVLLTEAFVNEEPSAQSARAIAFPDIVELDSPKAVVDFANANEDLKGLAEQLGTDRSGAYVDPVTVAEATGRAHVAIGKLLENAEAERQGTEAQQDRAAASFLISEHGRLINNTLKLISEDDVKAIFRGELGPDGVQEAYEKLQRGRTLLEVMRAYDLIGADASPKGRVWPQVRPRWVKPVEKAAPGRLVRVPDPWEVARR